MKSRTILLKLSVLLKLVCGEEIFYESGWTFNHLIPNDYNKHVVPKRNGSVEVKVGIKIDEVVTVTEATQSYTIEFFLHQHWQDYRLQLPPEMKASDMPIILDSSWATRLWVPDIYFRNAIESKILNVLNPIMFFTVGHNGQVKQTVRMNVRFQCKMDLSNYPQDVQWCPIDVVSLTRNNRAIKLRWSYFTPPTGDDNPKFRIRETKMVECEKNNYLGNFSCIRAQLKMVRRVSYYVIRIYAPTFLTTIASFVGFWIPVLAWPARVALLVTPLLTLVTQNININTEIDVSYVVAIHWWMFWCITFVFMGLVEFAVAIAWAYSAQDRKTLFNNNGVAGLSKNQHYKSGSVFYKVGRVTSKLLNFSFGYIDYTKDPLSRNKVDYLSRIAFPFAYLLFVVVYVSASICPWAANYNW